MDNKTIAEQEPKPKRGRPRSLKDRFPRDSATLRAMTADEVLNRAFDGEAIRDAALIVLGVMRSQRKDIPAKVKLECAKLILDRRMGLAVRQDQKGDRPVLLSADESELAKQGLEEATKILAGEEGKDDWAESGFALTSEVAVDGTDDNGQE